VWIVAVLVFACCLWAIYLLISQVMTPRLVIAERLAGLKETIRPSPGAGGRWSDLPTADRIMGRLSTARVLEHLLDEANLPMKPFEFVLIVVLSALAASLGGLLLRRPGWVAALAGMIGFFAPIAWVRLRRLRRRDAFARQIPDALQAIGNSLRAGYGFSQGMAVVASDSPPPTSVEFARAQREMNLGSTVEEVLHNMSRRMQSIDFDLAVSGILINRQVGGNLAELLTHITATIRERVKLKAFIRVLTAEQRLSAIIIMAVPPVMLFILLTAWREYTSYLLFTRIGHVLLAGSILLQLLGVYFIRRIVAIEI
jgi:tight adherence protein B